MKVVLVNHSDSRGGASVVSMRLLEALRREGVVASMVVAHKSGSAPEVILTEGVRKHFLREHAEIFLRNGLSRKDLFKASIATSGLELHKIPEVAEADIVVLNWINQGMMSLKEIALLAAMGKKIVWTMHDMWNMTGICHHAATCPHYLTRCHDCPLLGACASARDLSASTFRRKERLYDSAGITFVSVSSWLTARAAQSALLSRRRVETIPVAFPVEAYAAPAPHSRRELGLPEGRKLVVICAARLDDPVKGLPVAVDALNAFSTGRDDCTAVFVGAIRDPRALDSLRMPHVATGAVADETVLRSVMAHASAVMSSSSYESFGATLLEGQAAGATPVAFTHDGRADIITDGISGYSAGTDATDSGALARALARAIDTPIPADALRRAAARYSAPAIARQYLALLSDK